MPVNLVVFQMIGFDVILRMNWLAFNYVNIDYFKNKVVFEPLEGDEFQFSKSNVCSLSLVIVIV